MKQIVLAIVLATFFISPDTSRADNFSLGGMAINRPLYEGSDESEIDLLPIIDISIGKWAFVNNERGLGFYVLKERELELGGAIGYYESRNEKDSAKLQGFDDISDGFDGRMFAKYNMGRTSLSFQIRSDLSDNHKGTLFDIGAAYSINPNRRINWTLKAATTFADKNYMQTYFGVSQTQANQTIFSSTPTAFVPRGGWKDISVNSKFSIDFTRRWNAKWVMGYKRLTRDAAYSPLVRGVGSDNQFYFGVGLAYKFSDRIFRF
ncbi:MAG: MipA/OmpV family protein [Nitrospina sp.]|jgi:MipA family protein|nr:MipA/OmpV family protein [Nitrospina sp.]MBT5631823.1 MipA/OmpV family protein [Nitrospina sp.]